MQFHLNHIVLVLVYSFSLYLMIRWGGFIRLKNSFLSLILNSTILFLLFYIIMQAFFKTRVASGLPVKELSIYVFTNDEFGVTIEHISYEVLGIGIVFSFIYTVLAFGDSVDFKENSLTGKRTIFTAVIILLLRILLITALGTLILSALLMLVVYFSSFIQYIAFNMGLDIGSPFLSLFDWLMFNNIKSLNFHPGFNLSLTLSIFIGIIIFANLVKNTSQVGIQINLRYFIFCIILGLGLFVTSYSLLNMVYNIYSFPSFNEWFKVESESGMLTMRISSFVILFGILSYTVKHIYNKRIKFSLNLKFTTIKYNTSLSGVGRLDDNKYSSIYFSQMGFYVLVFCVLLYAYRLQDHSLLTRMINLSLFFILDDWAIIYFYSARTQRIGVSHRMRIVIINSLLFIFSSILLWTLSAYVFLVGYAICSFSLYLLYRSNLIKITTFS